MRHDEPGPRSPRTAPPGRWRAAALLAVVLSGCSNRAGPGGPARGPGLTVAAASDLRGVLPALLVEFRARRPGIAVEATYGSSGQLARQIRAGAPFDLYLAANEAFVKDLAAERLVLPGSVRPYAVGSLVVARRRDAAVTVETLADLARPGVKRVAIANPDVAPYGAAARQALTRAGLWEKVEPKVVLAESVRQAAEFVESGNAEAGLIGRASADLPELRSVAVDPSLHDPIVQSEGVVAASTRPGEAEELARFLLTREAQVILVSYGFKLPTPTPAPIPIPTPQ